MIYFISDTHFNHDREFVYGPRGFKSVKEMNETLIKNWNETVTNEDDIYVLGIFSSVLITITSTKYLISSMVVSIS